MEPTSEQELKQLLEEGRITEEEYRELLEAIRQKETVQKPVEVPQNPADPIPRTGYAKAALILMIAGFVLPIATIISVMLLIPVGFRFQFMVFPFILLGMLCELLAFIFGIIGWKTPQGKIAAIGVPCLGLLVVPGLVLLSLFSYHRVGELQKSEMYLISHQSYPLDSMERVLTQDGVEFDREISSDGGGSLKIVSDSTDKAVVRLFETGPIGIEYCMLIYSAKLRSEGLLGDAYLEMLCGFEGKGEFFSRDLERSITGTTEWTTVQTPFRLEAGQMPGHVTLNLVIEGTGTVWIDDIKLSSSPLN